MRRKRKSVATIVVTTLGHNIVMPRDSLTEAFSFVCTIFEQITADVKPNNSIRFTGDRFCFITGNFFRYTSNKAEPSYDCKLASTTIKVLSWQRVNKHCKEVKSCLYSLPRDRY